MPVQVHKEVSRKTLVNNTTWELIANVEGAIVIVSDIEQVSNDETWSYQAIVRSDSRQVDGKDPILVYE